MTHEFSATPATWLSGVASRLAAFSRLYQSRWGMTRSATARSAAFRKGGRLLGLALLGGLLAALVLVATATLPALFGYHIYTIEGGSMAPSLKIGSVAVAAPTSPYALRTGDIIAWRPSSEGPPVLHRIVEVGNVDGDRSFMTQGDANHTPDPDPLILRGSGDRVVYTVPYAGYILDFARSWPGRFLLLGVPAACLAYIHFRDTRRSSPANREPKHLISASAERSFRPGQQSLSIMLAGVSGFRDLMGAEATLDAHPAVERATVTAFKDSTASFEITLTSPINIDEVVSQLRGSTDHQLLIEEAEPEEMHLRLRFVTSGDEGGLARAA